MQEKGKGYPRLGKMQRGDAREIISRESENESAILYDTRATTCARHVCLSTVDLATGNQGPLHMHVPLYNCKVLSSATGCAK